MRIEVGKAEVPADEELYNGDIGEEGKEGALANALAVVVALFGLVEEQGEWQQDNDQDEYNQIDQVL